MFIYILPLPLTIFLIYATAVYLYIFSKLHKTKRKQEALSIQVSGNATPTQRIRQIKRSCVPFWIIIAFVLFNIVTVNLRYCSVSLEYFHVVYHGLYRIRYIINTILYISKLDKVRVKLSKLARLVLNRN